VNGINTRAKERDKLTDSAIRLPIDWPEIEQYQMEQLDQEYQVARECKAFNLTQRIQGLLLVSQGME
jgi:hypothetical protein